MLTDVNRLAAYLYLLQGEQMPAPILDEEGELDVERDNVALQQWSERRDDFSVDTNRLERFISRTEQLLDELENLEVDEEQPVSSQYMTLFYDAAKDTFDHDKSRIRTYFLWLYLVLFQKEEGSRWGEFVRVYGVENFCNMVRERFASLI